MKSQPKSVNRQTLKLFWQFTKPYPLLFWYGTLGAVLATVASNVIPPLVVASAFNHLQYLYAHHLPITIDTLMPYLVAYVATILAGLVLWRTQIPCVWKYDIYAMQKIADHIFDHLQHMGTKFHANRFGGSLVSQANKFITAYDRVIADFTWSIMSDITALIGSLIVLSFTKVSFSVVYLAIVIAYLLIVVKFMKKLTPYNRALSTSESDRTAKLADTITNIASVRAFAGEQHEARLFHEQTTKTANQNLALMRAQMKAEIFSQSSTNAMQMLAFVGGLLAIVHLNVAIGALYLLVSYTINLTDRLWQAMFVVRNINRAFGDASDMTEILQLRPEVSDPATPEKSRIHRGEIVFDAVDFGYPEQKKRVLFKNLGVKIKPGEKIGLVGHSGGGKTTLTQLLLRFMDIQNGAIRIDGQDITAILQSDLRASISYVAQEPLLFHRSLHDNIAYAKPQATREEVIAVAKMAHAHDFIENLPEGYETLVGERGVKLSGGQRQRVAIARAMLKNAPILVLDEATSALDSESEALIQDALWKLMEGRTALVIAHRLSTIQKMDRILVMEEGKISEQGTHKELIRKNGIYASLWNHQSGGFLDE